MFVVSLVGGVVGVYGIVFLGRFAFLRMDILGLCRVLEGGGMMTLSDFYVYKCIDCESW
jgi:hypothetical protein